MNQTYDRLIDNAMTSLDRAGGDVDSDFSGRLTQQSIAYALIAIAQELHKINYRGEAKEIDRSYDDDYPDGPYPDNQQTQ